MKLSQRNLLKIFDEFHIDDLHQLREAIWVFEDCGPRLGVQLDDGTVHDWAELLGVGIENVRMLRLHRRTEFEPYKIEFVGEVDLSISATSPLEFVKLLLRAYPVRRRELETLKYIRKMLSSPDSWTKGTSARDYFGRACNARSPSTKQRCPLGSNCFLGYPITQKQLSNLLGFENDARLVAWNDAPETTHAAVLVRFDAAIENLKMK